MANAPHDPAHHWGPVQPAPPPPAVASNPDLPAGLARRSRLPHRIDDALPPHAYFLISAVFHYLGPAFAVLLFAEVDVLGVAWLRIATATVIFAVWRRPWRLLGSNPRPDLRLICSLGLVLGAMNAAFYLALDRLPLGTVGAIEFLGPIALAASATRSGRNLAALGLAVAGVGLLADVRLAGEPLGFVLAGINAALFVLYVVLGHRAARSGMGGIDCLAAAMLVAMVAVSPVGFSAAMPAFARPGLLLAGIGVGVCSSVIPYVSDQLAMARLSRGTFAFLLALLPACATAIGIVVLRQIPSLPEIAGVGLIVAGVALRRESPRDVETPGQELGAGQRPHRSPAGGGESGNTSTGRCETARAQAP